MFKISTRGQYALLIMSYLAGANPEKYVSLKTLAIQHKLSTKYLEQIMIQLSKAGLVSALRGTNGGYKLIRKPENYTAGEILRVLEGDLSPKISIDNLEENKGIKKFWDDFEQSTNQYVDSVTLEDIAQNDNSYSEADYIYYI